MLPSITRLDSSFPGKGKIIRQALESVRFCKQHPAGIARIAECFNPPSCADLKLSVINSITEGHGVEYIAHKDDTFHEVHGLDYVNMGDTYITTVIYDYRSSRFILGDWGTIIETREGQYL
jgi:hypothetical protein